MEERAHIRYQAVNSGEDWRDRRDSSRERQDLRYSYELPVVIPWKSIFLALFLLSLGTFLLLISHFIFTSHMEAESSQGYGFLVLGIIVFLPGFYETRMAYYAWRGAKGYSYSKIPAY